MVEDGSAVQHVVLREQRALRRTGRARRVEHDSRFVPGERLAAVDPICRAASEDVGHHEADIVRVGDGRLDDRAERRVGEHRLTLGLEEQVAEELAL